MNKKQNGICKIGFRNTAIFSVLKDLIKTFFFALLQVNINVLLKQLSTKIFTL